MIAKSNIVYEHFITLKPKAQRLLTKKCAYEMFQRSRIFCHFDRKSVAVSCCIPCCRFEYIYIYIVVVFLSPRTWMDEICMKFIINTIHHQHHYALFSACTTFYRFFIILMLTNNEINELLHCNVVVLRNSLGNRACHNHGKKRTLIVDEKRRQCGKVTD